MVFQVEHVNDIFPNHRATVRLKTLRVTPAMAANVNDRPWSLEELVERTTE